MNPREHASELHPFEFHLSREDKERLRRLSAKAGVSMSEYIRRAINSCAEGIELGETIGTLKQACNAWVQG